MYVMTKLYTTLVRPIVEYNNNIWSLSQENLTPHFWFPPVQIYRNIWTPRIIYFNFAEIFGPPEQKFLKYFIPPSFYQHIA